MTGIDRRFTLPLIVALAFLASPSSAMAEGIAQASDSQGILAEDFTLSFAAMQAGEDEPVGLEEEASALPVSFDITYYLYSDYVFRGINFSEYQGEGREKPNHQVTTDLSVDIARLFGEPTGQCGTFSFGTFFEWYAAQKKLDPISGGQNLQEIDYVLSWSYDIEPLATGLTLGYTFYTFPNAKAINTGEWFVNLEHNDAWLWKSIWPDNEDGVLNPYFLFAQDIDVTAGGCWMELGISHDFTLGESFVLTPAMVAAIDHRYIDRLVGTGHHGSTQLAYLQYGLTGAYNLSPALGLPEEAGAVTLSGFLYFNDALGNLEDHGVIRDEFYGGMSIGWAVGG